MISPQRSLSGQAVRINRLSNVSIRALPFCVASSTIVVPTPGERVSSASCDTHVHVPSLN